MAKKPAAKKPAKNAKDKAGGRPAAKNALTRKGDAPKQRVPRKREQEDPCAEMRLVIVIGSRTDDSLRGAEKWALERARTLGGTTHIWRGYSNGRPLQRFRAADISGGDIRPDRTTYRRRNDGSHNFGGLLPDFQDCQGRITELVIFHHGSPVDEAEVAQELLTIFRAIRVPVCRIVWWACNAAVALDVSAGGWTDSFMMEMGGRVRCEPCGCASMIELIWPTAGKCGINDPDDATQAPAAKTGDGKVHRLRWGYPQPDGSLGPRPDPTLDHTTRWPNDREPPRDQPTPTVEGAVMGLPVSQGTF